MLSHIKSIIFKSIVFINDSIFHHSLLFWFVPVIQYLSCTPESFFVKHISPSWKYQANICYFVYFVFKSVFYWYTITYQLSTWWLFGSHPWDFWGSNGYFNLAQNIALELFSYIVSKTHLEQSSRVKHKVAILALFVILPTLMPFPLRYFKFYSWPHSYPMHFCCFSRWPRIRSSHRSQLGSFPLLLIRG